MASSGEPPRSGRSPSSPSWASMAHTTCPSTGAPPASTSCSTASSQRRRAAAWPTTCSGSPVRAVVTAAGSRRRASANLPTIFDRLEERGISWKFYVEDYDPRLTIAADGRADRSTQAVRVPLLNFPRVVRDRKLFSHIVDLDEYYDDLERGTLPAVAYIAPAGGSEHPPGGVAPGQTLVRTLVNALARSEAWRSAAFMWTYDEWGGWFDHVPPPRGPRLPRAGVAGQPLRAPGRGRQHATRPHLDPEVHRGQLAARAARRARRAGEEPRRRIRLRQRAARAEAHRRRPELCVAREPAPLADLSPLRRRRDACVRFDRAGRLSSRAGSACRDGGRLRARRRPRRRRTPRRCLR